jgi:hypothetical protein
MIAIVTVLVAFPLGYFVRNRLAAFTVYAVAYLWAFTFQTLYLLLDTIEGGAAPAFEPGEFPLPYGLVTLLILLVGFALVSLGHWVRDRRTGSGNRGVARISSPGSAG